LGETGAGDRMPRLGDTTPVVNLDPESDDCLRLISAVMERWPQCDPYERPD
jgi:hypothetical protein